MARHAPCLRTNIIAETLLHLSRARAVGRFGIAALSLAAAIASGCGDDPSPDNSPADPIARADNEPAGANCEHGGTAIHTGLDIDDSGQLDDDEIVATSYACDEPDTETVVRIDPEPPGANCANGGTAVRFGPDTNHNGVLDDTEVAGTQYACNDPTPSTLARTDAEPPGNCPSGGAAIHTGLDTNHNSVLDDDEITDTEYICSDVIVGDVVVATAADAATLTEIVAITGDVTIAGAGDMTQLDLPHLAYVGGTLELDTGIVALSTVRLDGLTAVGGDLVVDRDFAVTTLSLGALASVDGDLVVESYNLLELELPALASIGGTTLSIRRNTALTAVSLPAFTGVDGVDIAIADNDELVALSLPALEYVWNGYLRIDNNETLAALDLRQLRHVGAALDLNDSMLAELGLPELSYVGGDVSLREHHAATAVDLGDLTTVRGNLTLWALPATALELPSLNTVGERMTVAYSPAAIRLDADELVSVRSIVIAYNDLLSDIAVASLATVDDKLVVRANALTTIALPSLTRAGELDIWDSTTLVEVRAPELTQLDTWLYVAGNTALTTLDLPALRTVDGRVLIIGNAALLNVSGLSALATVEYEVEIYANASMTSIGLPALHTIGEALILGQFGNGNPALKRADLPALRSSRSLGIQDNDVLDDLHLPALSHLTDGIWVGFNPALPTCLVDQVAAQLDEVPPTVAISDTDDDATCD